MGDTLILLKKVEKKFDEINADYGSKKELCIYCKAKTYDGKKGIIHQPHCIILNLRAAIEEQKELEKIVEEIFNN
jgi:hypothetical protein